jgi:hypothetical protein
MINIFAYLPIGSDSTPVTREELVKLTGATDRDIRRAINEAKKTVPVVNVGLGYYIADDPDDPNLRAYILQETHRIKEISKGLRKHKWLYKINKSQESLNL